MKQQWKPPELEEMPAVILSLHQKWWQKMAAGEKVLRMALIVYSLNEEQKTCEMCRQVLLQEPECETCSTYKNTKGLQQQFEDLQRQLEKAAVEV